MDTLTKIKQSLRISHNKLDEAIQADIDACLLDLRVVGIVHAAESDPLIFNAIKLWCRAYYTEGVEKAAQYFVRYEKLKAALMMAEGYGYKEDSGDE